MLDPNSNICFYISVSFSVSVSMIRSSLRSKFLLVCTLIRRCLSYSYGGVVVSLILVEGRHLVRSWSVHFLWLHQAHFLRHWALLWSLLLLLWNGLAGIFRLERVVCRFLFLLIFQVQSWFFSGFSSSRERKSAAVFCAFANCIIRNLNRRTQYQAWFFVSENFVTDLLWVCGICVIRVTVCGFGFQIVPL